MVGTGLSDGVKTNARHHEDNENALMSPMSMDYPETPNTMIKALKDAGKSPNTAKENIDEARIEEGTPSKRTDKLISERILSPTRSMGNVEVTIDLHDTNAIHDSVDDSLEGVNTNTKRNLLVSTLCHQ